MPGKEVVLAQPSGGDDVQPVGGRQALSLRRFEQLGPIDVVQNEQATVRLAGVGWAAQLGQNALELEFGVDLPGVGKLDAERGRERRDGGDEVFAAFAAHLPAPAAVFVGEGVGILDSQRGLAHAAQPVHRREHADFSQRDGFAQAAQFGNAANEVRVVRVNIAAALLGAFTALDAFDNPPVELRHALLHFGFRQRLFAFVKPRAEIDVLAAAQLRHPFGAALVEVLVFPAGHFDEVDGGDALA